MKAHNGMRPQDVVILLKIISLKENWLNKDLANTLHISASEVSESLNRSMIAKLITPDKRKVLKNALFEFIRFGLNYVFPAIPGPLVRGVPTAHSAPVLDAYFPSTSETYVWPSPNGNIKGQALPPLHPNQVLAAKNDQKLYDMLALADAVRIGRVREKQKALDILAKYFDIEHYA